MSTEPEEPAIAQKAPYRIELKATYRYAWCACGLSKMQPFCDGSHKTTEFKPVKFNIAEAKKVWLCGCKRSGGKPFCDGTHKKLA